MTVERVIRDDARGRARARPSASRRRAGGARPHRPTLTGVRPRRAERPPMEGKPLVDWDWIVRPPRRRRRRGLAQHLQLTAHPGRCSASSISLFLAIWAVRQPRVYGPVHAVSGHPVHDPEPGGLRVPPADLRALAADRDHPAHDLHAAHPRAQQRRRGSGRCRRRPRGRRGHGLHAPRAAAPRRAAAGGPADDRRRPAGGRDHDRPRDRRVRSSATRSAGSASSSPRGSRRSSRRRSTSGAVAVDRARLRRRLPARSGLERRADAVGPGPGGTRLMPDVIGFLADPANWPGPTGIPTRLARAPLDLPARGRAPPPPIGLPIGLYIGHTGRFANARDQPRQHRPGHPVVRADGHRSCRSRWPGADDRLRPGLGLTFLPIFIAMTLLAIPPILVGAYAGLREVDRDLDRGRPRDGHARAPDPAPASRSPSRPRSSSAASGRRRCRSSPRRRSGRSSRAAAWAGSSSTASPGSEPDMLFAGAVLVTVLALIVRRRPRRRPAGRHAARPPRRWRDATAGADGRDRRRSGDARCTCPELTRPMADTRRERLVRYADRRSA